LERSFQLSINSPQNDFALSHECIQRGVLIELDGRNRLILGRTPRNLALNSVAGIDEDLARAIEQHAGLLRIVGNGSVTWDKNVGIERS
jgi:hypothetical protein